MTHWDHGSEGEGQTGREASAPDRADVHNGGRRRFLGAAGGVAAIAVTGLPPLAAVGSASAHAGEEETEAHLVFRKHAYVARSAAADTDFAVAVPLHPVNGDEEKYTNLIGSDTRGLPHDERGEVDRPAFDATLKAYASGDPVDFEAIPLGGKRKQLNPIGSLAVNLTGCIGPQFAVPPAPALDSATRAGEAVELYWQSILRDVPLSELTDDTSNKDVVAAVNELSKLAAFNGPRTNGSITPQSLFRGTALYVDAADPSGRTSRYVTPPRRSMVPTSRNSCSRTLLTAASSSPPAFAPSRPGTISSPATTSGSPSRTAIRPPSRPASTRRRATSQPAAISRNTSTTIRPPSGRQPCSLV
ncbi:hypothetical protein [Mesorhizobium sp. M0276]|uniref:hypothetical protein n=1 Tax=Mesorhizobium sp. M0276 TaxID=2956928 RepID=UPI00333D065E